MATDPRDRLIIENARIIFRNFEGREGKYNAEGDRNFCVLLDDEIGEKLKRDGWNVRTLESREEGEPGQLYIEVKVSYKNRPPNIVTITSRGRTSLPEDMIEMLDWADIKTVDLSINPYEWVVGGKTGVKAYLNSLFVTINEDYLDLKYADVREIESVPARAGRTYDYVDGEVVDPRAIER
jgi:hypothetical protein